MSVLPRQFGKVVMRKESGDFSATAYLLSQEKMVRGLEVALEEFPMANIGRSRFQWIG